MAADLQPQSSSPAPTDAEAIRHLKESIASGKNWFISLLEAIGLWQTAEEVIDGRRYRYLIDGEAFDWLLLAERLLTEIDRLVPADEQAALLFHGKPPLKLTTGEFKKLIGDHKYRQYLNYFYGVIVEEALAQAVEEEVHKERRSLGFTKRRGTSDEVYSRIYGDGQSGLLRKFCKEKGLPGRKSIGLTEMKEFTYWLFRYRLNHCDKARVASDTRKALEWLKSNADTTWGGQPVVYVWTGGYADRC